MIIKYHGFVDCCFGKQLKCVLIDPHRNMYCENVMLKTNLILNVETMYIIAVIVIIRFWSIKIKC